MDSLLPLDDNQPTQQKPKRELSKKNPGISLEDALQQVTEVKLRVGKKGISNAMLENEFGVTSIVKGGPFATILSAARQFGLIEGGGEQMAITELALSIIDPMTEKEKSDGIRNAFLTPPIYRELAEEFDGEVLPTGLSNILARRFGISDSSKERVASLFSESATFAGFLGADRVLRLQNNNAIESQSLNLDVDVQFEEKFANNDSTLTRIEQHAQNSNTMIPGFTSATHQTASFALTGDKRGFFAVPFDASLRDIEIMKSMLDVMAMRLKDESGEAQAA